MIELRRSHERGHANHGWLDSWHSFSFADYYDLRHMGFGPLRVEIITYVLEGALGHKDSMGNGSTISPGDVQRMSAGSGVRHSEFNHEKALVTHFLQIWIEPNVRGIAPSYEQKHFAPAQKRGRLRLIASPDARDGSLKIHQMRSCMPGSSTAASGRNTRSRTTWATSMSDGEVAEMLLFDLPDRA